MTYGSQGIACRGKVSMVTPCLPYTFACQRYANACGLVRTLTDVISHSYAGFRLTYRVLNLTRSWSRGKRFESARRLSDFPAKPVETRSPQCSSRGLCQQ